MDPDLYVIVTAIVSVCVGVPLARGLASRIAGPARKGLLPSELAQRLERIEHAVEAIAVEVERIGEGQRFTTQLLASRAGGEPAARAGDAPGPPAASYRPRS